MIRTFRYRIYPTKQQERTLNSQLAICCELYNAALQERRDAWKFQRKTVSWFDQNLQLKEIRQEREDVRAVNANTLEDTLHRVHLAFAGFFRRVRAKQKAGYPRFRSTQRYNSLTFRQLGDALTGNTLRLPKIGKVRIRLHRPLDGLIKTLSVRHVAGRWYAAFMVETRANILPFSPNVVGIDVGLRSFATLSDGSAITNPRWFQVAQKKLRRLQRRAARRRKGSHRRRKAVFLLRRFYVHIREQRVDFHHNQSRKIVNTNGLIAVEDLNIKGLIRGWFGKAINDAAWANFIDMLTYKAEDAGRLLVKVNPCGTSQTCLCGASVVKTISMREHVCEECGLIADRDHVSAQLILGRAVPSGVNVGDLMPCVA